MLPGMTGAELAAVELQTNMLLPLAVRDLFSIAAGFSVGGFTVDFRSKPPIEIHAFRKALPIAADRNGIWIIDHDEGGWHPVFYVSQRPPVVIIQASCLTTFIAQGFEPGGPRGIIEPLLAEISRLDPYAIPRRSLMDSRDRVLSLFAHELDDTHFITDLRGRRAGIGFAWQPGAPLQRAHDALVFGVPREAGALRRLFSWAATVLR